MCMAPTGDELFFWPLGAPAADSLGVDTSSGRPYGAVAVTLMVASRGVVGETRNPSTGQFRG